MLCKVKYGGKYLMNILIKLLILLLIGLFFSSSSFCNCFIDINYDNQVGLEELIYSMKLVSIQSRQENILIENKQTNLQEVICLMKIIGGIPSVRTLPWISSSVFLISNKINELEKVMTRLGFYDITEATILLSVVKKCLSTNFICGNLHKMSTFQLFFTGEPDCRNSIGLVELTPLIITNYKAVYKINAINITTNYNIKENNKDVSKNCTINSNSIFSISKINEIISITWNFKTCILFNNNNCGKEYLGELLIEYETMNELLSLKTNLNDALSMNGEYFQGKVDIDILYSSRDGVDGQILKTSKCNSHHFDLDSIIIDNTCNVPVSGLSKLKNGAIIDFNQTTCSNQNVSVDFGGFIGNLGIDSIKDFIIDILKCD